jgi:hypothetical protein
VPVWRRLNWRKVITEQYKNLIVLIDEYPVSWSSSPLTRFQLKTLARVEKFGLKPFPLPNILIQLRLLEGTIDLNKSLLIFIFTSKLSLMVIIYISIVLLIPEFRFFRENLSLTKSYTFVFVIFTVSKS